MSDAELPVRIVLLYGGQSAEHAVSRVSAAHVLRAIDPARYEVEPVAITPDGRWLRSDATVAALAPGTYQVRYEGDRALVTVGPGIAYRMEAAGRRIAIDDSVLTRGYGPERTREQPTDGVVRITSDATATAGEGEELIATQPLGPDGAAGTIKVFVSR